MRWFNIYRQSVFSLMRNDFLSTLNCSLSLLDIELQDVENYLECLSHFAFVIVDR